MLRLVKTVRDKNHQKAKKEKGGLSNESKEVENESSWSCSSSYGCRRSTTAWAIDVAVEICTTMEGKQTPLYIPKLGVKQVLVVTTW